MGGAMSSLVSASPNCTMLTERMLRSSNSRFSAPATFSAW